MSTESYATQLRVARSSGEGGLDALLPDLRRMATSGATDADLLSFIDDVVSTGVRTGVMYAAILRIVRGVGGIDLPEAAR